MMEKIRDFLLSQQDTKYRNFTLPILPSIEEKTFIGVRLPIIKKYAKKLSEEDKKLFLDHLPHYYHEENILHAFILSNIKDYDLFIERIDAFLPFVSNWATCDSICNKNLTKYRSQLIKEIYKWLKSEEVYRVRYAIKCLMNYYLDEYFKEDHLQKVIQVHLDDYYVKMMIAWYVATGLAKNYDVFIRVIEEKRFDAFIHNKAIQKAIESYRISDEHKAYLRSLKLLNNKKY